MGRKHQKKQSNQDKSQQNKEKDKNQTKDKKNNESKSTSKTKVDPDVLVTQAIQGVDLLQQSDDELSKITEDTIIYCLDIDWFNAWQEYVGAGAIWCETDPTEEERFGKKRPSEQNSMLIRKDTKSYHKYPADMFESQYLNTVLKNDFNEDHLRIINEETWKFFKESYPEIVEIPRAQLIINGKIKSAVNLSPVWLGFVDHSVLRKFHKTMIPASDSETDDEEEQNQSEDRFDFYKIQVPDCYDFNNMEELWIRFYLSKKGKTEKRDQFRFRIWKIDQTLHIQKLIDILDVEFKEETYRIKGEVFDEKSANSQQFYRFTSPHYKFILEAVKIEKGEDQQAQANWILTQHPNTQVGGLCSQEKGKPKGLCEKCTEDKILILQCLCKKNYYCSRECQYKDKVFHSYTCDLSYDSESDEEVEKKVVETFHETGLVNLGNTCYMNSGLQCLAATSQIAKYFQMNQHVSVLKKEEQDNRDDFDTLLTQKFAKFLKALHSAQDKTTVEPWPFKIQFGVYFRLFRGYDQQDAQEFVANMIEIFNDQLEPAGNHKQLVDQQQLEIQYALQSTEEQRAREYIEQLRESMCSELFCDSFLGLFRSALSCSGCDRSSVNFEQFSSISLPIADKRTEVSAYILFVPFNLGEDSQSIKISLEITSTINVQEFLIEAANKLKISEHLHKRLLLTLCSNERILQTFIDKPSKKGVEFLKEVNSNKYAVIFELPEAITLLPSDYLISSYSIKLNHPEAQNKELNKKMLVRPLIISPELGLTDIYQMISKSISTLSPQAIELTELLSDSETEEQQKANEKLLSENLGYQLLFLSEKQRRHKQKDICIFCQSTDCRGCVVPFNSNLTFQEFIKNYNSSFSFILNFQNDNLFDEIHILSPDNLVVSSNNSNAPTLTDCLRMYSAKETLDEDNMWDCSTCGGKRIANKQVGIYYAPRYLLFQLKRFKSTQKGTKIKNTQLVNYNLIEDFSEYVHSVSPFLSNFKQDNARKLQYRLYGVVLHSGQIDSGHYTAYTMKNDKWAYYDDEEIKQDVKTSDVISNQNAYILFYELME